MKTAEFYVKMESGAAFLTGNEISNVVNYRTKGKKKDLIYNGKQIL